MVLDKQFHIFQVVAPEDFKEQIIAYWIADEGATREFVLNAYGGEGLDRLCKTLIGHVRTYKPDLGYSEDKINGTLCFEKEDDNFVIPVSILHYVTTNK